MIGTLLSFLNCSAVPYYLFSLIAFAVALNVNTMNSPTVPVCMYSGCQNSFYESSVHTKHLGGTTRRVYFADCNINQSYVKYRIAKINNRLTHKRNYEFYFMYSSTCVGQSNKVYYQQNPFGLNATLAHNITNINYCIMSLALRLTCMDLHVVNQL